MGSCKKEQVDGLREQNLHSELLTIENAAKKPIVGLKSVDLGLAESFVVLSKTGITDVSPSSITGDIGASPISGAAILVLCSEVSGDIFSLDSAGPLPCRITNVSRLSTSIGKMQASYTDAAGRINPNYLNLGAGNIGGLILKPGLYKWTSNVVVPTNITISGEQQKDQEYNFQYRYLKT